MGVQCEIVPVEAEFGEVIVDAPEDLRPRPPVVTVMGTRRPRQDVAARRGFARRDVCRRGGIGRHHAAHRRFTT